MIESRGRDFVHARPPIVPAMIHPRAVWLPFEIVEENVADRPANLQTGVEAMDLQHREMSLQRFGLRPTAAVLHKRHAAGVYLIINEAGHRIGAVTASEAVENIGFFAKWDARNPLAPK